MLLPVNWLCYPLVSFYGIHIYRPNMVLIDRHKQINKTYFKLTGNVAFPVSLKYVLYNIKYVKYLKYVLFAALLLAAIPAMQPLEFSWTGMNLAGVIHLST